jgi:hypothetical protein
MWYVIIAYLFFFVGYFIGKRKEFKQTKEFMEKRSSDNQLLDMVYNHFDLN